MPIQLPSLLDDDVQPPQGQFGGPPTLLPDPNAPDQGAGLSDLYNTVTDYMARQRQQSRDMGLWEGGSLLEGGHPTAKGLLDAANQYTQGVVMGTTAPGEGAALSPGLRVSTRVPTAVGTDAAAVHAGNDLQINTDAIRGTTAEPKVIAKLQGYQDVPTPDGSDVLSAAAQHFKDNLRWIYDNMIPAVRDQAARWYDGANKLTGDLSDQYGVPHEAVAGMTARLSPGTDWYQNVSMAKRMLDIHANQQDAMLAPEQAPLIQSYVDGQKKPATQAALQAEYDGMAGTRFADMTDMQRAMFIRSLDEAKTAADPTNGYFPVIHPEGYELGVQTKADKVTPTALGWQSLDNIAAANSILRNPDRANISGQLGDAHKIRSFYNNIIDPNSTAGDVTVDTHQIAASHLLPIGISDQFVEHGMSGPPYTNQTGSTGLYGVYADAVRSLASDLNLLPRQVQSITWEGARGLFPAAFKRSKTDGMSQPDIFRQMWSNSTDAAATRDAIGARRGVSSQGDEPTRIPAPDWFTPSP